MCFIIMTLPHTLVCGTNIIRTMEEFHVLHTHESASHSSMGHQYIPYTGMIHVLHYHESATHSSMGH